MSEDRDILVYLEDIVDAASKSKRFINNMDYAQFIDDDKTSFAVVRALEIIDEAAKKVPDSVRYKYPEVPWRSMAGMRDKLIHNYTGVDWEVVWNTVQNDVPEIIDRINNIIDRISE